LTIRPTGQTLGSKNKETIKVAEDYELYDTAKIGSRIGKDGHRPSNGRLNTQLTASAHAQHIIQLADETPKDRGRVDRESLIAKPKEELDPLSFENEKVFQLVLDSPRLMEESRDSDIYGSQMPERAKPKRFSVYKETSFDSLHSADHLFVTGSADIN